MPPTLLLTIYCLLILVASLAGGVAPLWVKLTHRRMELAVSAVAGFMMGVALLHLLPHAVQEVGSVEIATAWILTGFLAMFFIERFFCFHHHDPPDLDGVGAGRRHDSIDRPHHHHELSWSGAAVGLTLHSVLAGVGLAASIENESTNGHGALPGLAVFLLIVLHKPFDSLSLATLMSRGGWSPPARHAVNALFALAVPLGGGVYLWGAEVFAHHHTIGCALAFATGVFLCISMSDLLPELQFHQHDRFKLSAMLLAGLALACVISWFEAQSHDHHLGREKNDPATHIDIDRPHDHNHDEPH